MGSSVGVCVVGHDVGQADGAAVVVRQTAGVGVCAQYASSVMFAEQAKQYEVKSMQHCRRTRAFVTLVEKASATASVASFE